MVATRRAAQPVVEDELAMDDPELALKKKPVRKTTAKTTKAPAKTETKAKTTRGKKGEPEPEVEEEVEPVKPAKATKKAAGRPKKEAAPEPAVEEAPEPVKPTRATKAGSVRGKKAVAIVEEPEVVSVEEAPKPTRATKAGSVRGRKAAVAKDPEPEPPVDDPKPTRSTKTGSVRGRKAAAVVEEAPILPAPEESKPTRSTRTTAKAPPLSPKKITQVSKPATRTTRNANSKAPAKAAPTKAAPKGRAATRKRTESNENADPEGDDDVEMASNTPVKTRATRGQTKKQESAVESEVEMSSRPTTPTDSAAQSFSQKDDEVDELQQDNESVVEELDTVHEAAEGSDDELCGPKTPMKRSSPGATARYYESVQRTIRKYEENAQIETPARRYAVLGSQRGTPQTEKPYCKPMPPSSSSRPMTVSRAANRAFVFRDLREGAPSLPENSAMEEQDELSFVVDEDIIPVDDDEPAAQIATPTPADAIQLGPQLDSQIECDIDMEDDTEGASVAHVEEEDEEAYIAPSLVEPDPEETMIIHDVARAPSPEVDPVESFETEDTVLITRPDQAQQEDEMMDDASDIASDNGSVIHHKSSAHRESISKSPEIAINFDDHLAEPRQSLPKVDFNLAEAVAESAPMADAEEDAVAGAEMEVDVQEAVPQIISRRQTVNLNEFINMEELADATVILDDVRIDSNPEVAENYEVNSFLNEEEAEVTEPVETEPEVQEMQMAEPEVEQAEASEPQTLEIDLSVSEEAVIEQSDVQQIEAAEPTVPEAREEQSVPHYALPTISFDARRKSLPVLAFRTPVKTGIRPHTSDGASMPRIANPFAAAWWNRQPVGSAAATPVKSRPSTAHGNVSRNDFASPAKSSKAATPVATPGERFPRLAPRNDYEDSIDAAAPVATPGERFPRRAPRTNYGDHAKTAAPVRFATPSKQSPKRRETFHRALPGQKKPEFVVPTTSPKASPARTPKAATPKVATPNAATPQITTPGERFPRLRPREDYEEHAKTVAAPVRFKTPPAKSPVKRPRTTQKPDALRRAALRATGSHTPVKTPLKDAATTPAQEPMTPHPAAPLRSVVAIVEVFTNEGASASAPFVALLNRLGAKTTRSFSDKVTHVIFKDGSPTTLQRVRLHNKEVDEAGKGAHIHCVNSRWVTDCDEEGTHKDEADEAYIVDVAEVPRGGKRRRKSMEPSALMNIGGNIVRDRKSSLGRSSIGRVSSLNRSPLKFDSPAKKSESPALETPAKVEVAEKENSGDDQSSPATPDWIAAPSQLVQQTAPMNRVRKLELQGGKEPKNRRLTFWNGGA